MSVTRLRLHCVVLGTRTRQRRFHFTGRNNSPREKLYSPEYYNVDVRALQ